MLTLTYAQHPFKIKQENGKEVIWDEVRRRWVRLTPEEWVRQNFIQYLIKECNYPASLMSVEKEIMLEDMRKRCDIVLYHQQKPWMIVECKEMNIPLNDTVLKQALTYNISLPVAYLVITNGRTAHIFNRNNSSLMEVDALPAWGQP